MTTLSPTLPRPPVASRKRSAPEAEKTAKKVADELFAAHQALGVELDKLPPEQVSPGLSLVYSRLDVLLPFVLGKLANCERYEMRGFVPTRVAAARLNITGTALLSYLPALRIGVHYRIISTAGRDRQHYRWNVQALEEFQALSAEKKHLAARTGKGVR